MSKSGVNIRRGLVEDAAALAEFGARVYDQVFGPDNDPENMSEYLARNYGIEQQSIELSSPDVITLIAESHGQIAGYAQVRRGKTPSCVLGDLPIELWRFYVDQPWRGKGLADRLMTATLDAARELGGKTIWLSVWEQNPRGVRFYQKKGFRDVGSKSFWVGQDEQTDRVMVIELDPHLSPSHSSRELAP